MRTSLLCLSAAITISALAQVPDYVPASGLVAWYPLNNSAVDAGPNGLNGTVSGSTAAVDRHGAAGGASAFSYSYDLVPTNPLFNTGAGMTVTAWVNLVNSATNQKVVGRVNSSFSSGFILGVESGQVHPEVWNSAGVPHSFSAGTVPSNTWTHLAITWATNGNLIVYVNGVASVSTAAGTSPIGSNSEPLIIGGSPWSTSPLYFPVEGSIDDIGIWDRALTPAEIMDVYNAIGTGIGQMNAARALALYPNPAGSTVTITSTPEKAGQHYQMIDAMGRTVAQGTLDNGLTTVGIGTLSSGVYSVRIGEATGNMLKLVKQ